MIRKRFPVRNIKKTIASGRSGSSHILSRCFPVDYARNWERFSEEERIRLFEMLPVSSRIQVFENLTIEYQKELLSSLNTSLLSSLLDGMAPDDRADMFSDLEEEEAEKLLLLMKGEEARDVRDLLEHEENTAGGIMTTEFVSLSPDMTAREALEKIQKTVKGEKVRKIYAVYVTDDKGRLMTGISLQRLLATAPDSVIKDITRPVDRIKVNLKQDQEAVADLFAHYDLLSVPVADDDDILVGVITVDDIIDVMNEEVGEDMAFRAGTEVVDFESGTIFHSVSKRAPWLMISFLGGIAAAVIIGLFEGALAQVAALAVFIPLIMDMGGNIGVQASTVVVRRIAMSRGEVNWRNVAAGELTAGFLMSGGFGILLGVTATFMYSPDIGQASGLGITAALALSTVLGVFLPIIFHKYRIDPAVATGPLITTAIDVVGLGVYFLLAALFVL